MKNRPTLLPRKLQNDRDTQEVGSRPSSYTASAKYPARNQQSRYNQEQLEIHTASDYYKDHNNKRLHNLPSKATQTPKTIAAELTDEQTPPTIDYNMFENQGLIFVIISFAFPLLVLFFCKCVQD